MANIRPLLILPAIPAGGHALESQGAFPAGNVPLVLDYAAWVESQWPGDILALMGGQAYDGTTAHALTGYRAMMAKRAFDIRVMGKPVGQVCYPPGSFKGDTDYNPNAATISTTAGKDAGGGDLTVKTPSAMPSFWDGLAATDAGQAVRDYWGTDSVLGTPAAMLAKVLKPIVWILVVVGVVVLIFKLPDFSGVKIGRKGRA